MRVVASPWNPGRMRFIDTHPASVRCGSMRNTRKPRTEITRSMIMLENVVATTSEVVSSEAT